MTSPHSWSPQQGGCVEQYQSSALRVLTYFVADEDGMSEEEEPEQHHFLLGSDWQVEVTQMVEDWLRVADPHLAQVDGAVLMGLKAGTTSVQVRVSGSTGVEGVLDWFYWDLRPVAGAVPADLGGPG